MFIRKSPTDVKVFEYPWVC